MGVSIALERLTASWAGKMVDSLPVDRFRMLCPPPHTAVIRAEPLFLRARRVMKRLATITTSFPSRLLSLHNSFRTKAVSAAVGLHRVLGCPDGRGNRRIAFALLTQIGHLPFLDNCHIHPSDKRP